jgi:hypothetical protein
MEARARCPAAGGPAAGILHASGRPRADGCLTRPSGTEAKAEAKCPVGRLQCRQPTKPEKPGQPGAKHRERNEARRHEAEMAQYAGCMLRRSYQRMAQRVSGEGQRGCLQR